MPQRLLPFVLLCSFGPLAACPAGAAEVPAETAAEVPAGQAIATGPEVEALASPSYRRRELARQRLIEAGEASRAALLEGLSSNDLEVRLGSRELLAWLAETRVERQIARLLDGSSQRQEVELPAWDMFCDAVGDAPADRLLFARIVRSHSPSLEWLDRLERAAADRQIDELLMEMNTFLPIELVALSQGDPDQWGLLLLAASQPDLRTAPVLSSRLRGGLLDPLVAERLLASPHRETLRRLIGHWLEVSSDRYINESMLKISLAYDCGEVATRLAMKTLGSRQATPASVVAAMTLLTRLEPEMARRELPRSLDDVRVWHMVATRRGAVRSQVGDVALALLLYLENYDPRQVGFDALEADPLTIYRDYTLGFDSDAQRRRAHEEALRLLRLELRR